MNSEGYEQEEISVAGTIMPPSLEKSLEMVGVRPDLVREVVFKHSSVVLKTEEGSSVIEDRNTVTRFKEGIIKDLFVFSSYGFEPDEAEFIAKREARGDLRDTLMRLTVYNFASNTREIVQEWERNFLRDSIFKLRDYLRNDEAKKKELLAYILSYATGESLTFEETRESYGKRRINQILENHSYDELKVLSKYLESLPGRNRRYSIGIRDGKILGFVPSNHPEIRIEKNQSISTTF